ncbi:MAG: hypothetical protein ACI9MC_000722 [Kiritimatiellia bacterium]|jgi:hypothetical protein
MSEGITPMIERGVVLEPDPKRGPPRRSQAGVAQRLQRGRCAYIEGAPDAQRVNDLGQRLLAQSGGI